MNFGMRQIARLILASAFLRAPVIASAGEPVQRSSGDAARVLVLRSLPAPKGQPHLNPGQRPRRSTQVRAGRGAPLQRSRTEQVGAEWDPVV